MGGPSRDAIPETVDVSNIIVAITIGITVVVIFIIISIIIVVIIFIIRITITVIIIIVIIIITVIIIIIIIQTLKKKRDSERVGEFLQSEEFDHDYGAQRDVAGDAQSEDAAIHGNQRERVRHKRKENRAQSTCEGGGVN